MATVNRHSLIQEFDTLKARFEALCAEGTMSPQTRALFEALRALFAVLMAVWMEKTTPKGSANSSLPSSRTGDDETALARPGAKAKGPAHHAGHCANTRTREHVKVLTVERCARCGEDLADTDCLGHQRRTLIDIVFETVVHHADAQVKHCPRCHTETRAPFPDSMPGPLQYGNGLKAYVVHLLVAQMLSLKRVAHSAHALIAHTLSEATLLHSVMPLHHALAHWERCAIERLLAMPALHVDETSLRVDRNNHWLHVYCGGALTVKRLHPKRGREAIRVQGVAWQVLNKVAHPRDRRFSRNVLVVAPGLTVRSRLAVLEPSHPENYYEAFHVVPSAMLDRLRRGRVVVRNRHALHWEGEEQVARRRSVDKRGVRSDEAWVRDVLGDMAKARDLLVINDEAHHAWRVPERAGSGSGAGANAVRIAGIDKAEIEEATRWVGAQGSLISYTE